MYRRVIPIAAALAIGFIVWSVFSTGYEKKSPAPNQEPVTPQRTTAQPDPLELEDAKKQVRSAVKRFVPLYYDRNEALFQGTAEIVDQRYTQRLETASTENFVKTYVTTLDLPQNDQFKRGNASYVVRVTSFSSGEFISDNQVMLEALLRRTYKSQDSQLSTDEITIDLVLKYVDKSWKVDACSCDS